MDDNALDRLFSGDLNKLSPLPKRVVRLFISSTFTDMTLERNSLMERVYPRLKKYCRERHGLDFQVVDMRWGVRDEATDDHQTVNLCSREIENCQRMSLGPNFVALLGDKYGFRPLCNRIKSSEYRALRRCLIELDINTDFLDAWYKEDLNAVPSEYLLQPISSILKNFTNKEEPELQSIDQRIWTAIQGRLHELLLIGSGRLVKQGRMSEQEQLMKYSISVTEREVIEGCLDINEAESQCLVYLRTIGDLRQQLDRCLTNLARGLGQQLEATRSGGELDCLMDQGGGESQSNRKASLKIGDDTISLTTSIVQTAGERKVEKARRLMGRFIDLSSKDNHWMLDEEAQRALANLRDNKLRVKLHEGGRNLTRFQLSWHEQDGISLKSEEHKQYLNELTEHFYSNLTRMIRRASKQESRLKSGLIGEVLQHSHYAKHVSRNFHGRADELDKIRGYVTSALADQQTSCPPMFIYGAGGSGKTSILARAATLAADWIAGARRLQNHNGRSEVRWNEKPCIVTRFCGTTPASSSMVAMLTSICRQLQFNFYQYGPLNGLDQHDGQQRRGDDQAGQLAQEAIPEDFVRLVFTFRQLLDNCQHQLHRGRLFVVVIDSVERLSSPVESSASVKYSWLTSIGQLPANVRLIVSCSSEEATGDDYQHLKRHFTQVYFRRRHLAGSSTSSGWERPAVSSPTLTDRSSIKLDLVRNDENYARLKRLVLPAARLLRAAKKRSAASVDGDSVRRPSSQVGQFEGWSLSLGPRRRVASMSHELVGFDADQLELGSTRSPVSLMDDNEETTSALGETWILHVKPMGVELGLTVVQHWLADAARTLSQQQWQLVERSLAHCSLPIFVKLAFGELINWKSYSLQSDSQGLTFGSSLLEDRDHLLASDEDPAIRRLIEDSKQLDDDDEGAQFRVQLLAMEQQWLNYLEHRQRREQAVVEESSNKGDDRLIIRVGAYGGAGAATNSSSAGGGGGGKSRSGALCHLSSTIEDAICQLFARIELQHGYVLTKHSLSYINAARNGICENELEDILSLDDVVLDDVFQYHLPPVRRIPPLLWTRIRNDLPDYLSERDADGIVVNWHHSQFKQVTQTRYMGERQQLLYVHSIMADYFLGRWADRAKPFRCTRQQVLMAAEQLESAVQQSLRDSQQGGVLGSGSRSAVRSSLSGGRFASGSARSGASFSVRSRLRSSDQHDQRLQWMQAKADRRVPHQPICYSLGVAPAEQPTATPSAAEGQSTLRRPQRRYNLRKLTELPHHLLHSGRYLELAEHVLFNYNWLLAALEATGLQALLSDFGLAAQHLERALDQVSSTDGSFESANSLAVRRQEIEMRGATAPDELEPSALASLLRQLAVLNNTIRLSCSAIHSDAQMLAPQLIGRLSPLVRLVQVKVEGQQVAMEQPNEHLAKLLDQCDLDGSLDCALLPVDHCLQAPDGLELSSLEGHQFAIMSMVVAADRRHLLAVSNRFIMWDIATGEISRDIDPNIGGSIMRQLKMGLNNEHALAYTSDDLLLALDILTQQVSRYQLLEQPGGGGQNILGLELIDRVGARAFVVWTKSSWFVFRLQLDESPSKRSGVSQLSIQLECTFSLDALEEAQELSISSVSVLQEPQGYLVLLSVFGEQPDSIRLLTLAASKASDGSWTLSRWQQVVEGCALALSWSLNRLVLADRAGDLYLTRMRASSWSRPKLLHSSSTCDVPRRPMAVELDSSEREQPSSELAASAEERAALAAFERQVDALEAGELADSIRVFELSDSSGIASPRPTGRRARLSCSAGLSFVRLYEARGISVLELGAGRLLRLQFPENLRNISVQPNKCQAKSIIVGRRYLAASIGRRLLVYSLESEQCLRSLDDAHVARIVELAPICELGAAKLSGQRSASSLCFASASMDRSVKIWNLANLDKDVHALSKLDGPIECLSVACRWQHQSQPHQQQQRQRSPELQLAACLSRTQVAIWDWRRVRLLTRLSLAGAADRFVRCRFSSAGRYLCVATDCSVRLYSVAAGAQLELQLCFERRHPTPSLARKLLFFLHDSRLLLTLECRPQATRSPQGSQSAASSADSQDGRLARRLLLLCYSLPDGQLLFALDHLTPTLPSADSHHLANVPTRLRLPVLTCDQLHLVCVQFEGELAPQVGEAGRRKSSAASTRLPLVLAVYSARDGRPVRSVALSQLELQESSQLAQVSVGSDQFTRLKAVSLRERQSVVALLDEERGQSFLVDVQTRQLLARLARWNGKLTSDGRFGLGGPASERPGRQPVAQLAAGLHLLEMRRGSPLKALLSGQQLAELAGATAGGGHSAPGPLGADQLQRDVICGFTRPNDAYVYYCHSRLKRLLLVRLRDNQLVANYKLSSGVRALKCAADGYALVLALSDGSLQALAIVDGQRNDSLLLLKQYPSRAGRRPQGAA